MTGGKDSFSKSNERPVNSLDAIKARALSRCLPVSRVFQVAGSAVPRQASGLAARSQEVALDQRRRRGEVRLAIRGVRPLTGLLVVTDGKRTSMRGERWLMAKAASQQLRRIDHEQHNLNRGRRGHRAFHSGVSRLSLSRAKAEDEVRPELCRLIHLASSLAAKVA